MAARHCKCGCGTEIKNDKWNYARGHKPHKGIKRSPPPSKKASIPEPIAETEEEIETVEATMNEAQIDAIYNLLTTRQRAIAVLTALTEEA
jgi:hypothetical protein